MSVGDGVVGAGLGAVMASAMCRVRRRTALMLWLGLQRGCALGRESDEACACARSVLATLAARSSGRPDRAYVRYMTLARATLVGFSD